MPDLCKLKPADLDALHARLRRQVRRNKKLGAAQRGELAAQLTAVEQELADRTDTCRRAARSNRHSPAGRRVRFR